MSYIPKSQEEAAFLERYSSHKYKKPSIACDCALYAWDRERAALRLLLVKRGGFPYRDHYALPGGFMNMQEPPVETAKRELWEETGIEGAYMELYALMGEPERDPRDRVVSPQYLAVVDAKKVCAKAGDDAKEATWFALTAFSERAYREENKDVVQYVAEMEEIRLCATACTAFGERVEQTFTVTEDGGLAFDHAESILRSLIYLRKRLREGAKALLYQAVEPGEEAAVRKAAFLSPQSEGELIFEWRR